VLSRFESYDSTTQDKIRASVLSSLNNIKAGARRRVRVRSGMLMKNITSTFDSKTASGKVSAKSPHAHLLEFGAKGVLVRPKNKKALHFKGGYSAKANIPARSARPFMRPAFEEEKPSLIKNVTEAVKP